ncbi:MAG: LytTR family DNA-binding domain-containing protein [Ekhidna sp.]
MKGRKKQFIKHLIFWVIVWFLQSLLFSGGEYLDFYLAKNIAIVSLQSTLVYINLFFLISLLEQKKFMFYSLISVVLIYLAYAISFDFIGVITSIFFPELFRVHVSDPVNWWPTDFWRILSGSAPYSLSLLSSTIFFLIVSKRNPDAASAQTMTERSNGNQPSNGMLTIKDGKTIHRIHKQDILYVEGLKEYVNWHTKKQKLITLHSLINLEKQLANEGFLRIHKSFLINTACVSTVRHNLLEINGEKIPIGRRYREQVINYFNAENED